MLACALLLLHNPGTAVLPCPQIRCLNEDVDGSCKNVFKAWAQRTQATDNPLRSDPDDAELLLHIP